MIIRGRTDKGRQTLIAGSLLKSDAKARLMPAMIVKIFLGIKIGLIYIKNKSLTET